MRIGKVAEVLGCSVGTLRFYERRGLVSPPYRSESNYRYYDEAAVDRMRFVRRCRELDMTLEEIEQLLAVRDQPSTDCKAGHEVVSEHIEHVVARICELEALKDDLEGIQRQCSQDETGAECPTLWGLTDTDGQGDFGTGGSHVPGAHGDLSGRNGR